MHLMYLLAIEAAESAIDLAASYFVPDRLLIEALITARGRDVRVRVLLPGPHIDALAVKIASKADWGALLRAGAEIHVYQPTMLHTKLLIIDSLFVSVGSTNFDMCSRTTCWRLSCIPLPNGRPVRGRKSFTKRFCYQSDLSFD